MLFSVCVDVSDALAVGPPAVWLRLGCGSWPVHGAVAGRVVWGLRGRFGAGWACGRGDGAWVSLFVARRAGACVLIGRPPWVCIGGNAAGVRGGAARVMAAARRRPRLGACCRLAAPVVPSTGAASTSTLTSWEARGRCRAGIPQPAQRQRAQQLRKVPGSFRGRFRGAVCRPRETGRASVQGVSTAAAVVGSSSRGSSRGTPREMMAGGLACCVCVRRRSGVCFPLGVW